MHINIPGELHRPKYMTVGSKRPFNVRKVAFHSWPFLMHTLLYPQIISILVNNFPSSSTSRRSSMRGCGVSSLTVKALTF